MWGIFAFLFGASIGSFLNVTIDRLPHGQSLVRPRSFCDACNRSLASLDMVPVVSYLWLRGRCRYCGAKIPIRVMFTEVITGILFTFLYFRYGFGIEFLVMAAVVSLMLVIAIIDGEHQLILDKITYPAIVVALILSPIWSEFGLSRSFLGAPDLLASFLNSLVAGAGAYIVFLIIAMIASEIFRRQAMGGGDLKLAGLIGVLVGFPWVLLAMWLAAVSGGLVAIALLVLGKKGLKDSIPYGSYLAGGAALTLVAGAEIWARYEEFSAYLVGAWT